MTYKELVEFFNTVKVYYKDLDSLTKRLQDDYAGDTPFEQMEEDRLVLGYILDKIDEMRSTMEEAESPANNNPLTIDELKALPNGDWVWLVKLRNDITGITGYYRITEDKYYTAMYLHGVITQAIVYADYGTKWLAYKNKEQAESKGEWVDFHCKVGDTVYFPWIWEDEDGVASAEVEHIATRPDGKFILYLNLDSDVVDYVMEYREHLISDFGKMWFTHKSEAEARLKELRGDGMTDEEKQEMVELEKKIDTALNEFNLSYAQRLLNRLNELKAKQSKEKPE